MSVTASLANSWATVVARLMTGETDGKTYKPSVMFIEFENNGGAAVTPPTIDETDGIEYYDGLSGTRDYLRVPLTASTVESTDDELYPLGNSCLYFAQTAGSAGENGLTFSSANSSRVYGGAIVSTPVPGDPTQDLLVGRFYYSSDDQVIKVAGSQVGVTVTMPLV